MTRKYGSPLKGALLALVILAFLGLNVSPAQAQAKPGEKEPKFEDVTLTTKDGVILRCTYYPGKESKQTVPLILLHGWGGGRGQLHKLAQFLQSKDHTIIVPDLRGHGRSKNRRFMPPLDRDKMKRPEIAAMVWDVEACKTFLLQKNNEGLVNIELLGVFGTGFGATLAMNWAAMDWNTQNLPTYKMGQDVKGLILVSPVLTYKGVTAKTTLKNPSIQRMVSMLLIAGRESRSYADTRRINNALDGFHDENVRSLVMYEPDSARSGIALVEGPGLNVPRIIERFINERLSQRGQEFPWTDRTPPIK